MKASESVVGIILAGGLARRMGGGDKCLLPLVGKTLLQRTIDRAQPQVAHLLLNANGSSLRFARTRLPVIPDLFSNNLGPLAGIHAGFTWMETHTPSVEWLVSFASDTPFFPNSLTSDFLRAVTAHPATKLVVATSKSKQHPVFALWHKSLMRDISKLLEAGTPPRLQDWVNSHHPQQVDYSASSFDPFFNINTPQDLYDAEPLAAMADK